MHTHPSCNVRFHSKALASFRFVACAQTCCNLCLVLTSENLLLNLLACEPARYSAVEDEKLAFHDPELRATEWGAHLHHEALLSHHHQPKPSFESSAEVSEEVSDLSARAPALYVS